MGAGLLHAEHRPWELSCAEEGQDLIKKRRWNSWMTIRVVAGLICRGSRLLVCQRRADASYPLKWEFPGGKLEEGESLQTALRRELKEELGIDVESASEFFRHRHSYPHQTVELAFFKVENYRGSITNKAFERVEWLDVAKLKEVDFLDGDLLLIEKLTAGELRL